MGRNRFVQPRTVRLDLSDGDWIDVKQELNAGEYRAIMARQMKSMIMGEKTELDPAQVGLAKVVEYVVDWSFEDGGKKVPVSEAAIIALDADSFNEIRDAVDKHEVAVEAAMEARKNGRAGEKASSLISPSVAG